MHIFVIEVCRKHPLSHWSPPKVRTLENGNLYEIHEASSAILFNCDNTYSLDSVENLLHKMKRKYDFKILVQKRYFRLQQMSQVCETTIPKLQMDVAIFVAMLTNLGSRSINEDNAGAGYARLYRALLQATGKVN